MKRVFQIFAGFLLAISQVVAHAQSYPDRPVRIVVPLSTGSATDALARLVALKLTEQWGKPVVVENMPGANTVVGTVHVVNSEPDGYSLLMVAANHVINANLRSNLPFDILKDVKPIARIAFTPLVLAVHPSVPVQSVKEFIDLAKAKPGQINYGSAGSGSASHLAGEMFKLMTGADIKHVPYRAISQAQSDLLGGHIPSMFVVFFAAIPQVNAGKLRALGVTSSQRMPQLPQVPTIDEAGVKGYELASWMGLAAPAGTSDDIVKKIHADLAKIASQPDFLKQVQGLGLDLAMMAPKEFSGFMVKDQARWAEVVKKSGARLD